MICRNCPYHILDDYSLKIYICTYPGNEIEGEEPTIGTEKDLNRKPSWCTLMEAGYYVQAGDIDR